MRRLLSALLALVLLAAAMVAALPLRAASASTAGADYEASLGTPPNQLRPRGLLGYDWAGVGSGIAGDASLTRGELVLEDRPFDDTGADTVPGNGTLPATAADRATLTGLCQPGLSYTTGDLLYPQGDDSYRLNAADLVQVRVAAQAGQLHVVWQLETLVTTSTTAVALLLDTDRSEATGSALGFRGFDSVVLVAGTRGSLNGRPIRAAADVKGNTVEAVLPLSSLPRGPWRVNAVSGLLAVTGMGDLADAVHVADEPVLHATACRLEAVQSKRLAARDLVGVLVDPAALVAKQSSRSDLRRGAFTRNYVPELQLGEGLVPQPRYGQSSSARIYRGTVQPYSVFVPASYDPARKNPVILLLHCLSCWHTVYGIAAFPGLTRLAESRGALIVTPFGYGEGGHYEAEAEADAFEVLSDVSRRYAVDQERLYLTGMSMGALGAFRLGLLHPDLWAGLIVVESYTTPFCPTPSAATYSCAETAFNYLDLFPNAVNIPVGIVQGAADELTPVTAAREFADTFDRLGYRYRYWEWPNRTHDPRMPGLTSDVTDPFLGNARRERSPRTVTYVQDRLMRSPGATYDSAYWLSAIRLAGAVRFGRIDAVSGGRPGRTTTPVAGSGSDAAGDWAMRGRDGKPASAVLHNTLSVTTAQVTAATVDLERAGLSLRRPLALDVVASDPLELRLGARLLHLRAGHTTVTLQPAGQVTAANRPELAATGGTPAWFALILLTPVLALRRRYA